MNEDGSRGRGAFVDEDDRGTAFEIGIGRVRKAFMYGAGTYGVST